MVGDEAAEIAELVLRLYGMHEVIIAETGGEPGLREVASLHAAAARPYATFDGQPLYPTAWEQAAALFHSLIKGHPFLDGNKRTALAAALMYLDRFGIAIPGQLDQRLAFTFCMTIADEKAGQRQATVEEIASWLKRLMGQDKA